jgi:hypothetical protein
VSSAAFGLQRLEYFIHNDFDALRIEMAGTLSGPAARSAYEESITALRFWHHRRLVVDITYVEQADEMGWAVLRAWQRLRARIVAASPASRAIVEKITGVPPAESARRGGFLHRLLSTGAGFCRSMLPGTRHSTRSGAGDRHPFRKITLKLLDFTVKRIWNANCVKRSERPNGSSRAKYRGEGKCFRRE